MNKAKDKFSIIKQHWRDIALGLTIVFVVGSFGLIAYGINQNNRLAVKTKDIAAQNTELSKQNKELSDKIINHVDCIIKDLSIPRPANTNQKIIELLGKDCNIKFTQ